MSYITTASGKNFNFTNPDPDTINIEDIAHALSQIARFGGHTKEFYSVAQHSVLAASIRPTLHTLMHDAHEAYIGDMPTPLKYLCRDYQKVEAIAQAAVAHKFRLEHRDPLTDHADFTALIAEARDLMGKPPWISNYITRASQIPTIIPLPPDRAKRLFLQRFEELSRGHQ